MVRRPLIGLSTRRWPASLLGAAITPAYGDASIDIGIADYPAAVAGAGGVPVHLARDAPAADTVDCLDGLLLSGGADIDPATYGGDRTPAIGPTEPGRDTWELELLAAALRRRIPVLAICRGMQLLNVAHGGTLLADIPLEQGDGHPRFGGSRHDRAHPVELIAPSVAAGVYGASVMVNSLHHQAVDRVGGGLRVSGRSPDGTVEALEVPGAAVLAVQWHPESLAGDPAAAWLVAAAGA